MVVIDDKTIDQISQLSQLELTEEEKRETKSDMVDFLTFFDQLKKIDVSQVEPLAHLFPLEMTRNDDVVEKSKVVIKEKDITVTRVIL